MGNHQGRNQEPITPRILEKNLRKIGQNWEEKIIVEFCFISAFKFFMNKYTGNYSVWSLPRNLSSGYALDITIIWHFALYTFNLFDKLIVNVVEQ